MVLDTTMDSVSPPSTPPSLKRGMNASGLECAVESVPGDSNCSDALNVAYVTPSAQVRVDALVDPSTGRLSGMAASVHSNVPLDVAVEFGVSTGFDRAEGRELLRLAGIDEAIEVDDGGVISSDDVVFVNETGPIVKPEDERDDGNGDGPGVTEPTTEDVELGNMLADLAADAGLKKRKRSSVQSADSVPSVERVQLNRRKSRRSSSGGIERPRQLSAGGSAPRWSDSSLPERPTLDSSADLLWDDADLKNSSFRKSGVRSLISTECVYDDCFGECDCVLETSIFEEDQQLGKIFLLFVSFFF